MRRKATATTRDTNMSRHRPDEWSHWNHRSGTRKHREVPMAAMLTPSLNQAVSS